MALKTIASFIVSKTLCRFASSAKIVSSESGEETNRRAYVIENISREISDQKKRLFAVIYFNGKQFKVSQDDIIQFEGNIPLDVGERIKLEKVLLIGGENFSVFGRPLLNSRFANVSATVIEKTTTSPDVIYNCVTDDVHHVRWLSNELTALRINRITLDKSVFSE